MYKYTSKTNTKVKRNTNLYIVPPQESSDRGGSIETTTIKVKEVVLDSSVKPEPAPGSVADGHHSPSAGLTNKDGRP